MAVDRLSKLAEQMLLCLIHYRTYASQAFVGLLFDISSPTVWRRVRAMTTVMAGHFAMPERRIKLSAQERNDLLYPVTDGTERPVQRPGTPSRRKARYSGKKKRHTASHRIITDDRKRILAVGPAQPGRKHDRRIYDEARVDKPPGVPVPGDPGYLEGNANGLRLVVLLFVNRAFSFLTNLCPIWTLIYEFKRARN